MAIKGKEQTKKTKETQPKGLLTRNLLLAKSDFAIEKVDFGDDTFIYVRQMSGQARDRFEQSLLKETKNAKGGLEFERSMTDFRAKLSVASICDEDGELILKAGDWGTLSRNMTAFQLEKIVNKAQEINNMTDEDKENLVKNSEGDAVAK